MRPTRRRRPARLTRIEQPSTSVGSIDSPLTSITRQFAGGKPVAGEPRAAELDAPGDAFLLDDGPVAGGRGQLGDADVVAVLEGGGARGRVAESRRGRGGGQRAASWPAGVGSSVSPSRKSLETSSALAAAAILSSAQPDLPRSTIEIASRVLMVRAASCSCVTARSARASRRRCPRIFTLR